MRVLLRIQTTAITLHFVHIHLTMTFVNVTRSINTPHVYVIWYAQIDCGTQAPTTAQFDPTLAISQHARNAIRSELISLPAFKRLVAPTAPLDKSIRTQAWGRLAREERVAEAATANARAQFTKCVLSLRYIPADSLNV